MKIGILTFHFGINYGGLLQCYALQQYLISLGYNVEVIDYIPPVIKKKPIWRKIVSKRFSLSKIQKLFISWKYGNKQIQVFELFRNKYLIRSSKMDYSKLSALTNEYDVIVVGSDQVWNPSLHSIGSYFLSHLPDFNGKRIGYAPCCAFNFVKEENIKVLVNSLNRFNALSVRNEETFQFLKTLLKKEYPVVVDPTLLWDFDELLISERIRKKKYILTYILGAEIAGGHIEVINRLRRKYQDTEIVSVVLSENKPQIFGWTNQTLWFATPQEWLSLFSQAEFVYTDSFHGLLFSIKYKKQFIAYYTEKARSSRFIDFSKRYQSVSSHIISHTNEIEQKELLSSDIDYSKLSKLLEADIQISKTFIAKSLV